jgi:predicted O-linked N-acetylglucosamine transferase (SPINDLY family)
MGSPTPLHSDPVLDRALHQAQRGEVSAAMESVQLLLRVHPDNTDALQVLGMLLTKSGRAAEAVRHLERAVTVDPNFATYRNNLGNALVQVGRHEDAATHYRAAIALDRSYWRAWQGLVGALQKLDRHDEALETCERAIARRRSWPEMSALAAGCLERLGRVEDAVDLLRKTALEQVLGSEGTREVRDAAVLALTAQRLFLLNYTDISPAALAEEHLAYMGCVPPARNPARTPPDPERMLRVGFLSGDLRTHSAGYFALPLAWVKPDDVEIICFATNPVATGDPVAAQYRSLSSGWVDCATMSDAGLDAAIRAHRIDVLLDLSGHTGMGRLNALHSKPAPVIMSAIGYPNTTGHPAVDYRIVDSITDPPGTEALATEALVRIDPCFLSYVPPSESPTPEMPSADAPPTFGSFNNTSKVGQATATLWAAAMARVPESRLLIKSRGMRCDPTSERLLATLESAGIARERVELLPATKSIGDHLALYSRIHVALDPTPYNGTTTTCEALWMGVPVVTMTGERHAARVSTSLLTAAGLTDWIAPDAETFARIAGDLVMDRPRLAAFRADSQRLLQASPLLDGHAYAARTYAAIRERWRRWCATQADAS